MYRRFVKRLLDFVVSLLALVILIPLILVIACLVALNLGTPVLFSQERPGKNERIFKMYKFRTMTNARDQAGNLLPDSQRLTPFGAFLRSTSLDELPELWNIVKGDMSLIGPRPLAIKYLPFYTEEERKRHWVKPGLSGLAQVNGRNSLSWEEKFFYDLKYVEQITFWNDMKIIIQTLKISIKRESIGIRGVDNLIDFDKYRKSQRNRGKID
ncbi:sugar transferase [Streptococcus suis]|nr:sugar transferase [Streptococcus suis]